MSDAPVLRDVTNEAPAEHDIPGKYAETFAYLSEQIAGFEEQFRGLEQAHRLTTAMRNDVLAKGAKDLGLDVSKWTFDGDKKKYVPIEEKKDEPSN